MAGRTAVAVTVSFEYVAYVVAAVGTALIWGSFCPVGRVRQPLQPSLEGLPLGR